MNYRTLTRSDKAFINENIGKLTDEEMAKHIGCGGSTVFYYRRTHDLLPKHPRFTREEKDYLRQHYRKDKTPKECAEHLGKSLRQIYNTIRTL